MSEAPDVPSDVIAAWERILERLRAAVFGEFEILREIGSGGMAAVYLARQIALNRQVAIKVMSPALLTGPGMVERFRQEAITIAGLDHPNIITIYAVRHHEDLHFFVMKFIKGRSLEHIIRRTGPLPVSMVRGLLFMIGSALAHAHRRGVIHRDVKPANILIDGEGNAIVTDFGIAKVSEGQSTTQTHSGVIIGTAAYMSPEQCYASPAKAASDQYSLGIVAYEMLTGHPPFTGSQFVVMQAHTERPVPSIREQRHDCPPELEAAVIRMLAKDPADRWPSIQHALAELNAAPLLEGHPVRVALAKLGVPDKEKTEPEPVPRPYVSSVAILAPPDWIEAGDELTLRASARSWSGGTMPGVVIRWHAEPPTVASVDETNGVVTALTPGMVLITASVEDVKTSVTLQVVPRRVASVTVSIPPGTMHVGDRVQLVARMEDKSHAELKRSVAWVTSDSKIGTISDAGILTCRAPGLALIFAEAEGRRGSAEVRVAPARVAQLRPTMAPTSLMVGDRVHLGATALDSADQILDDRVVSWVSRHPAVATITPDGVVTALAAGHVEFTCSCEGKSAVVELDVEAASALGSVSAVDTGRISIPRADTPAAPLPESISDIFDTPRQIAGEATIAASRKGVDAAGRARVVPAVVASVSISLPPGGLHVGDRVQLVARTEDESHAPVKETVRWASGDDSIAAVSTEGVLSANAVGRTTIWAESQGVKGSVHVDVEPKSIATIEIGATPETLEIGETARVVAVARDIDGNVLAGRVLSWETPDRRALGVTQDGEVRGLRVGLARLQCRHDGITATKTIHVIEPVAARIAIHEMPADPIVGRAFKLQANVFDRRGGTLARRVDWNAEPSGVVEISQNGKVTPVAPGNVRVRARAADATETISLTIAVPAPARVNVADTAVAAGSLAASAMATPRQAWRWILSAQRRRRSILSAVSGLGAIGVVVWLASEFPRADAGRVSPREATAPSSTDVRRSDSTQTTAPPAPSTPRTEPSFVPPSSPKRVAKILVVGVPKAVLVGNPFTVIARALDDQGVPVPGAGVTWSSSNASIASVDRATGAVIARSAGRATLTAESDGVRRQVTLSVAGPAAATEAPAAIKIQAPAALLRVYGSVMLIASRSGGGAAAGTITWTSDDSSIARVDLESGKLTGVSEGNVLIRARAGAAADSIRLRVGPAPVAELAMEPSVHLTEGAQARLQVTLLDQRNRALSGREIRWQSENPDIASVENGLVTAHRAGSTGIAAQSEEKRARVLVSVDAKPVPTSTPPPATNGADRAAADPVVASAAANFVAAINARNSGALQAMLGDADSQRRIQAAIASSRQQVTAGAPTRGSSQFTDAQLAVDFTTLITWRTGDRRQHSAVAQCRAVVVLRNGAWTLQAIRVGNDIE
jgi:uncharacterized protein YjdB